MKTLKVCILTYILLLSACGSDSSKPEFKVTEGAFSKSINKNNMPVDVDLTRVKKLVNNDYPIEVALFKDGKWFYNLANLGAGEGTYHYEDGVLKLFAARDLFDIYIEVRSADVEGNSFRLTFSDRHGFKVLPTELNN